MSEGPHIHPSDELMGAFLSGRATHAEVAMVVSHLEGCRECRHVAGEVSLAERDSLPEREDEGEDEDPVKAVDRFRAARRFLPAAAAVVVLALLGGWFYLSHDPLARLIAAADETPQRMVEARLAEFEYRPRASGTRSSSSTSAQVDLLRSVAKQVLHRISEPRTAQELHAAGVAALIAGDDRAVDHLREAVRLAPTSARYSNDLAAALYARGRQEDNPHDFAEALAAADRAVRSDPEALEARFNRALILEALGLTSRAVQAWDDYLRRDPHSAWTEEASQHRARLRAVPAADLSRLERLVHEPAGGDEGILGPLVAAYPEAARRRAEAVLLGRWGSAVENGCDAYARALLIDLRQIGHLLVRRNGDRMVTDAVAAIDRCGSEACVAGLAEAHRRYDAARRRYGDRLVGDALPEFETVASLFAKHGSPMAGVARYYAANCLEDHSRSDALRELQRLLDETPEGYGALRAQIVWTLGSTHGRVGDASAAANLYERAIDAFTRIGETANANRVRSHAAAVHAYLGAPQHAWRLRLPAFTAFSANGFERDLHEALDLAARTEVQAGHWEIASSLLTLGHDPKLNANPRTRLTSLVWEVLALHRAGDFAAAQRRLADARKALSAIKDAVLRADATDDLAFAQACVIRQSSAARSAAILDRYIESVGKRARLFNLGDAYLERARAALGVRAPRDAERFYRAALINTDNRRRLSVDQGFADAYFGTAQAASTELAQLLVAEGRKEEAFEVLERGRGRALLERLAREHAVGSEPLDTATIRRSLPPGVLLLSYVLLPDRLLVFSLDAARGLNVDSTNVSSEELRRLTDHLHIAIERHQDDRAERVGQELYRIAIAPADRFLRTASTLVIVADPAIADLPFAMLRAAADEKRLIDRAALVHAPSATMFARSAERSRRTEGSVAVFGDPAFDRALFPDFEPLPQAEREAKAVARRYAGAELYLGRDATAVRLMAALESAKTLHLATHGLAMRDSARSMLLMAPGEGRSGSVLAREIAASKCSADLVVLAGCRTAMASEIPSDIDTMALAFLAAGARNVVGTLWNVDDDAAAVFSVALHADLAAGKDIAQAVRSAQRSMMRTRPLRDWAAFSLTGAGR